MHVYVFHGSGWWGFTPIGISRRSIFPAKCLMASTHGHCWRLRMRQAPQTHSPVTTRGSWFARTLVTELAERAVP